MKLAEYMKANQLTDQMMAAKTGQSRVSVTRHRNGTNFPKRKALNAYKRVSNGLVTADGFMTDGDGSED